MNVRCNLVTIPDLGIMTYADIMDVTTLTNDVHEYNDEKKLSILFNDSSAENLNDIISKIIDCNNYIKEFIVFNKTNDKLVVYTQCEILNAESRVNECGRMDMRNSTPSYTLDVTLLSQGDYVIGVEQYDRSKKLKKLISNIKNDTIR